MTQIQCDASIGDAAGFVSSHLIVLPHPPQVTLNVLIRGALSRDLFSRSLFFCGVSCRETTPFAF